MREYFCQEAISVNIIKGYPLNSPEVEYEKISSFIASKDQINKQMGQGPSKSVRNNLLWMK